MFRGSGEFGVGVKTVRQRGCLDFLLVVRPGMVGGFAAALRYTVLAPLFLCFSGLTTIPLRPVHGDASTKVSDSRLSPRRDGPPLRRGNIVLLLLASPRRHFATHIRRLCACGSLHPTAAPPLVRSRPAAWSRDACRSHRLWPCCCSVPFFLQATHPTVHRLLVMSNLFSGM